MNITVIDIGSRPSFWVKNRIFYKLCLCSKWKNTVSLGNSNSPTKAKQLDKISKKAWKKYHACYNTNKYYKSCAITFKLQKYPCNEQKLAHVLKTASQALFKNSKKMLSKSQFFYQAPKDHIRSQAAVAHNVIDKRQPGKFLYL